jgi:hypothetical protein
MTVTWTTKMTMSTTPQQYNRPPRRSTLWSGNVIFSKRPNGNDSNSSSRGSRHDISSHSSHGYVFFFFALLNNYLHLEDYENHDNNESPPHHTRVRPHKRRLGLKTHMRLEHEYVLFFSFLFSILLTELMPLHNSNLSSTSNLNSSVQ